MQKSRFSNFFLCTLQSTEVLSHAMPPTFKNKLYAGGKYLQVTSFCKTFFGHRFFLLLHISHQNYVNLIFAGRAKPVPPPRSHSLEQSKIGNISSSSEEDGSDISTNPSTTAKNENLIAGKKFLLLPHLHQSQSWHSMNFLFSATSSYET